MEAIGEFDNDDAHIFTNSDEKFSEVVTSTGQVTLEISHTGARLRYLCDAINQKCDVATEHIFDLGQSRLGILDSVVEYSGDHCVDVHCPVD